ncbi:MAG: aminotransferase class I/II-fold pyridoxal phosphate-dependent enzyme [Gemmatimonadota bacterium]
MSRRGFMEGLAVAAGAIALTPAAARAAEVLTRQGGGPAFTGRPFAADDYDSYAKLAANENPYGPSDVVMAAMTAAFKYSNRYGYPDGHILEEIARLHGVDSSQVLLGAGSGELLSVAALAFLGDGRRVIGSQPTFDTVFKYAAGVHAESIQLPLRADYTQDIAQLVHTTRQNWRDVGLVYICNPNNPTGRIVSAKEIRTLLDDIPEDVPVLIDEAYHHFVEDPAYASSLNYVMQGRQVIITRTFSKISGLAGMRLGYAIAPRTVIDRMRPHAIGSINALVKHGALAALTDTDGQARVKQVNNELRARTVKAVQGLGYEVIPSEANFFMVHIKRPVLPVIAAFKEKGVLVGRPFPPMINHLRVSVGTPAEMERFLATFGQHFSV